VVHQEVQAQVVVRVHLVLAALREVLGHLEVQVQQELAVLQEHQVVAVLVVVLVVQVLRVQVEV